MTEALTLRPVENEDVPFLWDMLWEAVAVDAGMRTLGKRAALLLPENTKYLDGWGRAGDAGVVAVNQAGTRLGAAWYRRFTPEQHAYGFVAEDIPELAIGVRVEARGQGVGTALLTALLEVARAHGERAISLSVDRRNPAHALYHRLGFRDVATTDADSTSATMVIVLEPDRPAQRANESGGENRVEAP